MSIIPRDVLFGDVSNNPSDLVISVKSDVEHVCNERIETAIAKIATATADKFFSKYNELYSVINKDLSKGVYSLFYHLVSKVLKSKPSGMKYIAYAYESALRFLTHANLAVIAIGGRDVCSRIVDKTNHNYEVKAIPLNIYNEYIRLKELVLDILVPYYDNYIKSQYTFGNESKAIVDDIELLMEGKSSGGMYGLGSYNTKVIPLGLSDQSAGEWCMSSSSNFEVIGTLPEDECSDVCIRNIYKHPSVGSVSFKAGNTHIAQAVENVMSALILPKDETFFGHHLIPSSRNFGENVVWSAESRMVLNIKDDFSAYFNISLVRKNLIDNLRRELGEHINVAFCRACLMTDYALKMSKYEDGFSVELFGGDMLKKFYGVVDLRVKIMEYPFTMNLDYHNETSDPKKEFSFTELDSIKIDVEFMPSSSSPM